MATDRRTLFDISWPAIAKILAALALIWVWMHVWQFLMVLIAAIIIAVALHPAVAMLEKRGVRRGAAAFIVVFLLAVIAVAAAAASWVSITEQSQLIVERLTAFYHQFVSSYPVASRMLPAGSEGFGQQILAWGRSAVNALGMFLIALVLTVYLLIEWEVTIEWLMAFVPRQHRRKMRQTLAEARTTVHGYVIGNVITSIITAAATLVALLVLKVPAALMLAIIAGLFDFIPVVGFLFSLAITAVLAATVSTTALVGVVVFYVAFNAVENYFVAPKVYGRSLALSNLAVLVAVAVGAQLGGVMGALLALPIAATYPAIERIWFRDSTDGDTVDIHRHLSNRI